MIKTNDFNKVAGYKKKKKRYVYKSIVFLHISNK